MLMWNKKKKKTDMNKSILKMKGYIILYLQLSYSDISRWNEKYRKLSPCLSKKN